MGAPMRLAARLLLLLALPLCCLAAFGCGSTMMTSSGQETPDWARFQASLPAPPADVAEEIAKLENDLRSFRSDSGGRADRLAIQVGDIGLKYRLPESTIIALKEVEQKDVSIRIAFMKWQLRALPTEEDRLRFLAQIQSDPQIDVCVADFYAGELLRIQSPAVIPCLATDAISGANEWITHPAVKRLGDFLPATRYMLLTLASARQNDPAPQVAEEAGRRIFGLEDHREYDTSDVALDVLETAGLPDPGKQDGSASDQRAEAESLDQAQTAKPPFKIPSIEQSAADLESEDWVVRRMAAHCLGLSGDPKAVTPLKLATKDLDPLVRTAAARALSRLETPAARPLLRRLLKDDDWIVRKNAAQGLGKAKDAEAVPRLLDALGDWQPCVRSAAARALGEVRSPQAVMPLSALLKDTDWHVRDAAVWALRQIKDHRAVAPLSELALSHPSLAIFDALAEIGDPQAVPAIAQVVLRKAGDPDWVYCNAAIKAICKLGEAQAIPVLARGIQDEDISVRQRAGWALGGLSSPDVLKPLLAALEDPDEQTNDVAASSIGAWLIASRETSLVPSKERPLPPLLPERVQALRDAGGVERLLQCLSRKHKNVYDVIVVLARIREPRAVPAIITLLLKSPYNENAVNALKVIDAAAATAQLLVAASDKDPVTKANAINVLGKLGAPQAFDIVRAAAKDVDVTVRRAGTQALVNFNLPDSQAMLLSALGDEDIGIRYEAAQALTKLGCTRQAVAAQLEALRDKSPSVRARAAHALLCLHTAEAGPPLIAALSDESPEVREAAAYALACMGYAEAARPLIKALSDASPKVRANAAHALGQIKAPDAIRPLRALMTDKSAEVRAAAASSLAHLGDKESINLLIAALSDPSAELRESALQGLVELKVKEAGSRAIAALKDPDAEVRNQATWCLATLVQENALDEPTRAVESLIAALADENPKVRDNAAATLRDLGDPRAVEPLVRLLKDKSEDVIVSAILALGDFEDARAITPLEELLKTTSSGRVRRWARDSLRQIRAANE